MECAGLRNTATDRAPLLSMSDQVQDMNEMSSQPHCCKPKVVLECWVLALGRLHRCALRWPSRANRGGDDSLVAPAVNWTVSDTTADTCISDTPASPTSHGDGPVDNYTHTLGDDGLNGSDFIPIDTSSGSEVFVGRSFSTTGMINDEEPRVRGPDAKLQRKVGSVSVTVKQHTEGRLADSRSMMNLSVDGLHAVDSVGAWLGIAFPADRLHPPHVDVVDELLPASRCGR